MLPEGIAIDYVVVPVADHEHAVLFLDNTKHVSDFLRKRGGGLKL